MKLHPFLLVAFLTCASGFSISVIAPSSLVRTYPGGLQAQLGLFGSIPFGSYVAGKVVNVLNDCCSPCVPLNFNATIPSIFLVPRGSCAFETKVYNAEAAGAQAALIYNTMPSLRLDLMDGVGKYNVSIPSALLSSTIGQALKKTVGDIVLNITFESSTVGEKVTVGFAFALENTHDVELIPSMSAVLDFGSNATLTPYFYIPDCPDCRYFMANPDCLCDNRYCSIQYRQGALVLKESIRQQCVYTASVQNNTYAQYVTYMQYWAKNCAGSPEQICKQGFVAAGIDGDKVQQCYLDSFGGNENADDNKLLAAAQKAFFSLSLYFVPTIFVGGDVLYGDMSIDNLNRAVCAHMNASQLACSHHFCAPGCWEDMLQNGLCDPACNVTECKFDAGQCDNPLSLLSVINQPQTSTNGTISTTNSTTTATNSTGTTGSTTGSTTGNTTGTTTGNTTGSTTGSTTGNTNITSSQNNGSEQSTSSNGATLQGGSTNSTPQTNSTSVPSGSATNSSSSGNYSVPVVPTFTTPNITFNTTSVECSPGCDIKAQYSSVCLPRCNNSLCRYQNWTCTCAPFCSPDLLKNDMCDSECNTPLCNYDNFSCSRISVPNTFFPDLIMDSGRPDGVLDSTWKKWVIISLSLFGFSVVGVVAVLCYLRVRASRRRRDRRDNPLLDQSGQMHLNASISPASAGNELEHLTADKIISLLGGRLFRFEMMEFGEPVCVVCMTEFLVDVEVCKTNCGHVFHYRCLQEWVRAKEGRPTCPMCARHPLEAALVSVRSTAP